ncbi:MAG: U32 family peptidase [Clostridia bacterium]|nr:U32 family peptidase [Clostridia bacterium]
MKKAEILAPAGGEAQLTAAVRSGADAVYLGQKTFNARMGADNFDDLKAVVSFCHARGVRVYVTFNTLWKQSETGDAVRALENVADSGADAILAADMGTVFLARECCPSLPLHASTQMTVTSAAGVRLMRDMGFSRCVLAREMSREEIREAARVEGIETEVFVHGALCMSLSGQCFLSSVLGGRSGNRGRCAQPCRLDFSSGGREYVLSLKDLSLVDKIAELEAMGVDSLKIEGRLKRPEYVAAAVTACRMARDGEKPDMDTLQKVFSRSGFTQGYYTAQRNASMFGIRAKEDEEKSREVLGRIRENYRREYPRLPLDAVFSAYPGEEARLTFTCGEKTVAVRGPVPERAENRELDEESIRAVLEKLGGTAFYLRRSALRTAPSLWLSASAVGAMRREAADMMSEVLGRVTPWPFKTCAIPDAGEKTSPVLRRVFLSSREQLTDETAAFADLVYLPLSQIGPDLIERWPEKIRGRIDRVLFGQEEENERKNLREIHALGINEVSVSSPAGIALAKQEGLEMYGECTLGIMNGCALRQYARLGLMGCDLTFECAFDEMKQIPPLIPLGCAVYAHLPLMTFRSCPLRGKEGCGKCPGSGEVRDRYGLSFPVSCRGRRYSVMLNPQPLYLGDKAGLIPRGISHSFYFTLESAAECAAALRLFRDGRPWEGPFTRALYLRPVK